jgi:hypothetical protein
MSKRRDKGEGSLHWSEARQRWIAEVTVGYTLAGKRIYRSASDKSKTIAKNKLRDLVRDHEDGLPVAPHGYPVADAVEDWLAYGLPGRSRTPWSSTATCAGDTSSPSWAPASWRG